MEGANRLQERLISEGKMPVEEVETTASGEEEIAPKIVLEEEIEEVEEVGNATPEETPEEEK